MASTGVALDLHSASCSADAHRYGHPPRHRRTSGPRPVSSGRVAAARENRREKPRATQIAGTSGSDTLDGTANADVIRGKSGNDTLDGGAGDDTVSGDGGNDVIRGGAGRDVLLGGAGNDKIFARDGEADTIACGRGRDVVQADRADTITGECEVVRAQ